MYAPVIYVVTGSGGGLAPKQRQVKHGVFGSSAVVKSTGFSDVLDLFTHILQGYFNGDVAILWLLRCHWSNHMTNE